MTGKITLKSVVCPGCVEVLPADNRGCTKCGYEDNIAGRILSLEEIKALPRQAETRTLNQVSPAFIAAVVQAARVDQPASTMDPAELEALCRDAVRYRQLRELTWYIDAAGQALNLIKPRRSALVDSPPRPDWDEVEAALDSLIEGPVDYLSPYT